MNYTDEDLNRLLDGELDATSATELRAELASNEALATRYAELAMTDLKFKEHCRAIDDKAIPQSILDLLSQSSDKDLANSASRNQGFRPGFRSWISTISQPKWSAIAAGFLALVVGFSIIETPSTPPTVNNFADYRDAVRYGVMSHDHPVAQLLSNSPSGAQQSIEQYDDVNVTPVLSFASTTGTYCREYTLSVRSASHRAVACHEDDGWRVVLSMKSDLLIDQNEYQTASATTPSAFNTKLNTLLADDPLSYQEELLLIRKQWKP